MKKFHYVLSMFSIIVLLPPSLQAGKEMQRVFSCDNIKTTCGSTPITTITTISTSGNYCLATALVGTTTLITIATSDVLLDLNGNFLQTLGPVDAIALDNRVGLNNITITNGGIHGSGFGSNGIAMNAPLDGSSNRRIVLSDLNINGFNSVGIKADTLDRLVIDRCNLDNNGTNLLLLVADSAIQNSAFNSSSSNYGAILSSCNTITVDNCIFNFNTLSGLYFSTCSNIVVNNCNFMNNQGDGCTVLNGFDLIFDQCTFNENIQKGIFVDAALSSPAQAVGYKLIDCQAMNNCDNGFTFSSVTSDIVLEACVATGNCPGSGFVLATAGPSVANLSSCVAVDNGTGFDISASSGSGLIKACTAVANGLANISGGCFIGGGCVAVGCGFNDKIGTLFQYVSNIAQGNGSGAATVADTNYCLSAVGSAYVPTTGGPGASLPFRQFGIASATSLYNPAVTAWNNITLQ